jgi:hypothetical protein
MLLLLLRCFVCLFLVCVCFAWNYCIFLAYSNFKPFFSFLFLMCIYCRFLTKWTSTAWCHRWWCCNCLPPPRNPFKPLSVVAKALVGVCVCVLQQPRTRCCFCRAWRTHAKISGK